MLKFIGILLNLVHSVRFLNIYEFFEITKKKKYFKSDLGKYIFFPPTS